MAKYTKRGRIKNVQKTLPEVEVLFIIIAIFLALFMLFKGFAYPESQGLFELILFFLVFGLFTEDMLGLLLGLFSILTLCIILVLILKILRNKKKQN